jgi:hypothetical protein
VDDARLELQGGGAGIVDLLRGTIRQAADGWALAVADRRTADLGGLGEWADVAEEMDLFALRLFDEEGFEFSVPRAWQQIARLLAAAERATLGDQGVPQPMVQLNVRPPNSVLPANILLSAAVTGGELPRLAAQYLRGTEPGSSRPRFRAGTGQPAAGRGSTQRQTKRRPQRWPPSRSRPSASPRPTTSRAR